MAAPITRGAAEENPERGSLGKRQPYPNGISSVSSVEIRAAWPDGNRREPRKSSVLTRVPDRDWDFVNPTHVRACFSTLALRDGTPNSLRQTSASTATPSRICWWEGLAKHNRNRQPE